MNPVNNINEQSIRSALEQTWSETLEVGPTPRGYCMALPQTLPDGWQLMVDLETPLPKGIKLTDQGRVLGWLQSNGQNIETEAMRRHIDELCATHRLERDGFELFHWLTEGFSAMELHLFSEGLIAVAYLHYLHEIKPRALDLPDQMLRRVFTDHAVEPVVNFSIDGQTRKKIRLDYYVSSNQPIGFHIIRRHGRILSSMEQWGFRWNDLRAKHPAIRPAMIYDPYHQDIDEDSRAIGEEVCDLFCSYEELDRIHEFLG